MSESRSTSNPSESAFEPDEAFARRLDQDDPLRGCRERFCIPTKREDGPSIYFAGNSLGLQPKTARELLNQELDAWARLGVDGHFEGKRPWYPYHELFRDCGARLVGGKPGEVVMMNSLTVNLHLMMVTFYRPTAQRRKILIDYPTFPSDLYAVKSQLRHHGFDPNDDLILLRPREGEHILHHEDILASLARHGEQTALVLFNGVNFFTGQAFDIAGITAAAKRRGCVVGLDCAHAAGNTILELHDWDVDFAVWCNYKYLNSGPGAVGGCFVHEKHGACLDLPRFAGWWGNDPDERFQMHLLPDFVPREGADGWQVSNPPIMAMAPIKASLDIFDEVGMAALRTKSEALTGYLQFLIECENDGRGPQRYEVITPREPDRRGCQLSILAHDKPKALFKALAAEGVVCDFREPNVVRVAPVPLYNTFHEVWRFARVLNRMV